ncbi:syndecan-4 [Brachyistius frenatus]|uniref:syndecan-4 n=1 Tax=Brachyistius frenatus TaxID=100188 RepID=UPI0037E909F3
MLTVCLVLFLSSSVFPESQVRETETWMPMKTTQMVAMAMHGGDPESSGDSPNGSDFAFTDDEDEDDDYDTDPIYEDDEFSGSGDKAATVSPGDFRPVESDVNDNKIPEPERPTVDEVDVVRKSNEIPLLRNEVLEEQPSNVLMSHAGDDSIFNKTEVLAALIAGGAVGLMFAVLLILLLIYRMKKKDEGSYDLGKKPIYKKAPTTEIYA